MTRLPRLALIALLAATPAFACGPRDHAAATPPQAELPAPPIAKRIPHELVAHGQTRIDDYYWLAQRDDPEVLAYLEAENAYTAAATAHLAPLRAELLAELEGRIRQDDASVPVRERDYLYYSRFVEGGEHPLLCRKRDEADASEEIMLDADALAQDADFFELGGVELSEGQQLLAYAYDTTGRRFYDIRIKDLRTGELLDDHILATSGTLAWAADDQTLFYVRQDPQTLRDHQVFRHTLGQDPTADTLVYEERDPTFAVDLYKTKSRDWLVIDAYSTLSNEALVLDAHAPDTPPRVFAPRERGLEYGIDHAGSWFYVRTNLDAPNFRLMRAPADAASKTDWRELVGYRDEVLIEGVELFAEHMVIEQRRGGLIELAVHDLDGREDHLIDFGEAAYVAYTEANPELDTNVLRFGYESMTTPDSVYAYDLDTRGKTLLKQIEVGGFEAEVYASERISARAKDGAEVPISLVYRPDLRKVGGNPVLVYAYGSYGSSLDASFSPPRLSLLDRGFIYAIAHVRGGEELGRQWYEDGKLLAKTNSFTDFIACADHLVDAGYADGERVFAEGGSAGGLLVGAVVNMAPDRFAGAIAAVPFVDVVTTMLDDSIPLTTSEYDEWGDPNIPEFYAYMLSYSPYDNVRAQAYPALLVTAGLHDSQVQYWEPAKWVAKLRATKTDDNPLLLRTDMSAGHGGKSGRLAALEDVAFEYAFLLDLAAPTSKSAAKP